MDDLPIFKPNSVPQNEVVLGVYGSQDWLFAQLIRERHLAGLQTLELSETFLVPAEFKLPEWVISNSFKSFTFFDSSAVVIPFKTGYLQVKST